jgi:hypothetical protein
MGQAGQDNIARPLFVIPGRLRNPGTRWLVPVDNGTEYFLAVKDFLLTFKAPGFRLYISPPALRFLHKVGMTKGGGWPAG